MRDILAEIVERRKNDLARAGYSFGFAIPADRTRAVHPFLPQKGVILEVKRASPSKGDIAPALDAAETARSYAESGAAAISCLTESNFFKGTLDDLQQVCRAVDAYEAETGKRGPAVLRKDFLLAPEEVEIAWRAGADAVLLIARILERDTMLAMAQAAAAHGMSCLIEVRLPEDLAKLSYVAAAVDTGKLVCGVNSRDLATFRIDLLAPCMLLPAIRAILGADARVVFESGVRTPEAAGVTGAFGFSGLLLGEAAAKNPSLRAQFVEQFTHAQETAHARFWLDYARSLAESSMKPAVATATVSTATANGCTAQAVSTAQPSALSGTAPADSSTAHCPTAAHTPKSRVKICGLTKSEDVLLADSLDAAFVGFIFAAGFPRSVAFDGRFESIQPALQHVRAKKIAVITDAHSAEAEKACALVQSGVLDCLQLHGIRYEDVPPRMLELPHYFAVIGQDALKKAEALFEKGEVRVLIDTKQHDEAQLAAQAHLWLAGGITPESLPLITQTLAPELIDISSGVEGATVGEKDAAKMKAVLL